MRILGISAFYHDSAAALIENGRVVAAAQEERFTRLRHDAAFPRQAAAYCLDEAGCTLDDVDFVAFYEKPLIKFERLVETFFAGAPRGFGPFARAIPLWSREKLFHRKLIEEALSEFGSHFDWDRNLLFGEHHLSHASSAFYPSPFGEALILTLDGVGEWATTSAALGQGSSIRPLREIHFPHSLGLLYSAFTEYLGFRVNSGEYKVMGLAPHGSSRFASTILDHLIEVKTDGSFWLDQSCFDYCWGLRMTSPRFHGLFGGPPRKPDEPLTQRHMDLAASVQHVLDEVVLKLVASLAAETGCRNLCPAGGVALNCVTNGKILRSGLVDRLWIPPAPGDAGGAIGAALSAFYLYCPATGNNRTPRKLLSECETMRGAYLGPSFNDDEVQTRLRNAGAVFRVLGESELLRCCVDILEEGGALGWFQGRMEFGPRALGMRSILADPRSPSMQSRLNLKIKYRESFRPFAPSVLSEEAREWFDLTADSPYMMLVADVRPGKLIPAVTHVDGSARVQTVNSTTNPRYHRLLAAFNARTGCPLLLNTSFNIRGEPIVCTPEDAFRCFMGTELDALAIGNCFLVKEDQLLGRDTAFKDRFGKD